MTDRFVIIVLTFLLSGTLPPVVAHHAFNARFLGGIWIGALVGVLAAAMGSFVHSLLPPGFPDLIVLGGAIDIVPPLLAGILVTVLYAAVSSTNSTDR